MNKKFVIRLQKLISLTIYCYRNYILPLHLTFDFIAEEENKVIENL